MARWTWVLLAVVLLTETTVARESSAQWYGSLYGGWAVLDDDRSGVEDGPLAGLGLGRFLSQSFSLSFEVERVFTEDRHTPVDVDHDFELNTTSLMARYYLNDDKRSFQPYVLAGLGLTDHSSFVSKSSNVSIAAGAGLSYQWESRWSSYVQAMYRRDTDRIKALRRSGLNDVVLSAGLNYAFDW